MNETQKTICVRQPLNTRVKNNSFVVVQNRQTRPGSLHPVDVVTMSQAPSSRCVLFSSFVLLLLVVSFDCYLLRRVLHSKRGWMLPERIMRDSHIDGTKEGDDGIEQRPGKDSNDLVIKPLSEFRDSFIE